MILSALLFLVLLVCSTGYYLFAVVFLRRGLLSIGVPSVSPRELTFSIVIAARNEEKLIRGCLDACFCQTLPPERFEVVVIDDRSTDATASLLAAYQKNQPRLRVVAIEKTPAGCAPKKYAVTRGVESARNGIVVMTDADCLVPPGWLSAIERHFDAETLCVQGITTYALPSGHDSLLYHLQAVDFLSHGIVAAAAIGAGMPLNSNANNFAFRKSAFVNVGGYGIGVSGVVSGDDDLLLQRLSRRGRDAVRFMADHDGAVTTAPTTTWKGVFEQRKRWGSKTVYYDRRQKGFLSGIFLFYCAIPAALGASVLHGGWGIAFCMMLLVKMIGEYLLMIPGTALFHNERQRPFILPASLLQLPMVLAAVLGGVFGSFSWKGERFRRVVSRP